VKKWRKNFGRKFWEKNFSLKKKSIFVLLKEIFLYAIKSVHFWSKTAIGRKNKFFPTLIFARFLFPNSFETSFHKNFVYLTRKKTFYWIFLVSERLKKEFGNFFLLSGSIIQKWTVNLDTLRSSNSLKKIQVFFPLKTIFYFQVNKKCRNLEYFLSSENFFKQTKNIFQETDGQGSELSRFLGPNLKFSFLIIPKFF